MKLHIAPKHLSILQRILQGKPYKLYAFGSRVTGKHKRCSDLDLCYFEAMPSKELMRLEEALMDSDLPYKVDLVDGASCNQAFQARIKAQMVALPQPPDS